LGPFQVHVLLHSCHFPYRPFSGYWYGPGWGILSANYLGNSIYRFQRYEYDAFGSLYEGAFARLNAVGYTGKHYDTKSDRYDYGFREYSPSLGRFTTKDPIKDGANWYAYCGNEPVNFTDPWGLCSEGDDYNLINDLAPSPSEEKEPKYPTGDSHVYGVLGDSGISYEGWISKPPYLKKIDTVIYFPKNDYSEKYNEFATVYIFTTVVSKTQAGEIVSKTAEALFDIKAGREDNSSTVIALPSSSEIIAAYSEYQVKLGVYFFAEGILVLNE